MAYIHYSHTEFLYQVEYVDPFRTERPKSSILLIIESFKHYFSTAKSYDEDSKIIHHITIVYIVEWDFHDDVIIWKYLTRYWPFVREIHR